jgi:hypothetical protein
MGGLGSKKFQDVMAALAESMNSGVEQPTNKKAAKDAVKKN